MARPPRSIDPEAMLAARKAYEVKHQAVDVIAERLGISAEALRSRIYRLGWKRKPRPAKTPAKRVSEPRMNAEARPSPVMAVPRLDPGIDLAISGKAGSAPQRAVNKTEAPKHKRKAKKPGDRLTLVRRVRRAVEGEISSAEKLLAQSPSGNLDVEKAARTLASLVRTLRELNALDGVPPTEPQQDGEPPRDLDEFRRDLAARLDRLRAEREQSPAGDPLGETDRDAGD